MPFRCYLALLAPLFHQREAYLSINDLIIAKVPHPGGPFQDVGDTMTQNGTWWHQQQQKKKKIFTDFLLGSKRNRFGCQKCCTSQLPAFTFKGWKKAEGGCGYNWETRHQHLQAGQNRKGPAAVGKGNLCRQISCCEEQDEGLRHPHHLLEGITWV